MLYRLRHSPHALVGLSVLAVVLLVAIFAPVVAPYDPLQQNLAGQLAPPSVRHLLGTDDFGRDIFSRVLYGARISLVIGVIAVGIAACCGTTIGLLAGYFGGWLDLLSQRVIDVMLAFPGLLLALAIIAILGSGLENIMVAIGISAIPVYARLIRGQTLRAKQLAYVEAARAIGAGHLRLMVRHIFPNVAAPLIILGSLGIADAILAAAGLSFIGLGAQPATPEWGEMLNAGQQFIRTQWWIATFPGLAIVITVLAFNLLGDGLRDMLAP